MLRQQMGRTRCRMPDDDGVRARGPQRVAGVHQRLAFFDARRFRVDDGGRRTHRLGGKLKGHAGPCGSLVEQQGDPPVAQDGTRLVRLHASRQPQQ